MKIVIYEDSYKNLWNNFVKKAKNSHFFFNRDFLEYHKSRFYDMSLMIFDTKDKLICLLPANKYKNILYTHQGLTFGGFIVSNKIKLSIMIEIIENVKNFLKINRIKKLIYKASPYIYHDKPYCEDIYALNLAGAQVIKRDLSEVIDLNKSIIYSNGRKHSIRKAKNFGFVLEKSNDFDIFWQILLNVLKTQHNSKPVHSLEEIQYLHSLFPKNIELFLVKKENKLYAGGITFVNKDIVKLQYVANYKEGRKLGALDFMIDNLLKNIYHNKKWFDFGTSSDNKGINFGLIDQKERFGASGVLYESYEWNIL